MFKIIKLKLFLEFFRYCIVGGTAFIVDTSIFYILTEKVRLIYYVSAIISFIAGITINYIFSKTWVFRAKSNNDIVDFIKFVIIGLIGLGITEIFLWIGIGLLNQIAVIVKIFAAGIVLLWNYIARKIFVFNRVANDTDI